MLNVSQIVFLLQHSTSSRLFLRMYSMLSLRAIPARAITQLRYTIYMLSITGANR